MATGEYKALTRMSYDKIYPEKNCENYNQQSNSLQSDVVIFIRFQGATYRALNNRVIIL